jgi:N-acetylglucosaminyldiphosphoundecaprenol N-acetyl-beta-D-mannosaminyltransferase
MIGGTRSRKDREGEKVRRVSVCRVTFDAIAMDDCVAKVTGLARSSAGGTVSFANPEIVLMARGNPALKRYLDGCDLILADGIGIVLAARVFGGVSLPERVTGTDFTFSLAQVAARERLRVAFVGGRPGVAQAAASRIGQIALGFQPVLLLNGYDDVRSVGGLASRIAASRAEIVMVCLGCPRQEQLISELRALLPEVVFLGNGGALDFWSGTRARAPRWLQRLGGHLKFGH